VELGAAYFLLMLLCMKRRSPNAIESPLAPRRGLLPAALLALAVIAGSRTARAEAASSPCKEDVSVKPRYDQSIPSNAVIEFTLPDIVPLRTLVDLDVQLEGPDAKPVAFTATAEGDHYLLRPAAAFVPGKHILSWVNYCYPWRGNYQRRPHRFLVTDASPLPTSIGSLSAEPYKNGLFPACAPYATEFNLVVMLSPEMLAYLPLATFYIVFDGTMIGRRGYQQQGDEIRFGIPATCGVGDATIDGRVELFVHIAGAAQDPPPVALDVSVACPVPLEKAPPPCGDDGGADDAPRDVALADRPDGEGPRDTGAPDVPSDTGGAGISYRAGCSCSAAAWDPGAASFLLLGLLVLRQKSRMKSVRM